MPRSTRRRLIAGSAALTGLATLAGCKPDIPLIPFIQSDRAPYGTMTEHTGTITPRDRSHRATPIHPHTAHEAARPLP